MVSYSKIVLGLFLFFAAFVSAAQGQSNNRVVVIPLFGDESTWQGPWSVDQAYKTADIIEEGGSSYIALKNHTASLANIPPDAEFWELVAASGAGGSKGDKGDKGDIGEQGTPGLAGTNVSVDGTTIFETIPDSSKPNEKTLSGITYTAIDGITLSTPDSSKPNEKALSGIVYTAGSNVSIITPSADRPNEKRIVFNPAGRTVTPNSPINVRNPYLGVNYIIAMQGVFPSRSGLDPFLADIVMFGGNFAPRGWAFCDGQLLPISQNTALFSLLGTSFGGDGRTTFALPDLRGRSPIGARRGPGLGDVRLGSKGGVETIFPTLFVR